MFDERLRQVKERLFGAALDTFHPNGSGSPATQPQPGQHRLNQNHLTAAALASTLVAGVLLARQEYWFAFGLWVLGRVLDGLDGALARRRGISSDYGGYIDLLGDTIGYAVIPVGLSYGIGGAGIWLSCAVLLASFYINTVSWAVLAAILEKRNALEASPTELGSYGDLGAPSMTSIVMPPALIEGTETMVFFAAFMLTPALGFAEPVEWLFWAMAAAVALNVVQRYLWAKRAFAVDNRADAEPSNSVSHRGGK